MKFYFKRVLSMFVCLSLMVVMLAPFNKIEASSGVYKCTTSSAYLYRSPYSSELNIICSIPKYTFVKTYSTSSSFTWVDSVYGSGYIFTSYLTSAPYYYNQHDSAYAFAYGGKEACCVTAVATMRSIMEQKTVLPSNSNYNWDYGFLGAPHVYSTTHTSQSNQLNFIITELKANRPCVIRITTGSSQHWVCVVGSTTVYSSTSLANLIIMDPYDGNYKTMPSNYTYLYSYKSKYYR